MPFRERLDEIWRDVSTLLYVQSRWHERLADTLDSLRDLPVPTDRHEKLTYNRLLADAHTHLAEAMQAGRDMRDLVGG